MNSLINDIKRLVNILEGYNDQKELKTLINRIKNKLNIKIVRRKPFKAYQENLDYEFCDDILH